MMPTDAPPSTEEDENSAHLECTGTWFQDAKSSPHVTETDVISVEHYDSDEQINYATYKNLMSVLPISFMSCCLISLILFICRGKKTQVMNRYLSLG